jgi:hypothetical protein
MPQKDRVPNVRSSIAKYTKETERAHDLHDTLVPPVFIHFGPSVGKQFGKDELQTHSANECQHHKKNHRIHNMDSRGINAAHGNQLESMRQRASVLESGRKIQKKNHEMESKPEPTTITSNGTTHATSDRERRIRRIRRIRRMIEEGVEW